MALQHRWTALVQFFLQRFNNVRMMVACGVDAVARQKSENPPAIFGVELRPQTARIPDVQPKHVQQACPLRIDAILVARIRGDRRGHLVTEAPLYPGTCTAFATVWKNL